MPPKMRDDEKYPSTIQYDQPGLELAEQAPPLPVKSYHDNAYAAELPGTQGNYDQFQRSQQSASSYPGYAKTDHSVDVSEAPGYVREQDGLIPPKGGNSQRRYCGLRKGMLIAVVVVCCIVLTAVCVGVGVAVSNNSKKSTLSNGDALGVGSSPSSSGILQPSQTASSGSSATSSASSAASSSSSASARTGSGIRKSASSVSGPMDGSGSVWLQTFTQDMDSGDLSYRLYSAPKTTWLTWWKMSLTVVPLIGTTITSTTQFDVSTNNTYVNVFYLTGNSTSANIVLANLTCPQNGPSCQTTYNSIVAQNIKYPVHPSSNLAATWLTGKTPSWRIYYSNTDLYISELEGVPGSATWNSGVIGGKMSEGGSIAVSLDLPSGLNVYFMDTSNILNMVVYKGGWGTPTTLAPAGNLNATTPLAAVYVPDVFTYQIFYLDTGGAMHSYTKVNATGSWAVQSSTNWGTSDPGVGISATAWDNEVRLFYFSGGKVNQAAAIVPASAKTAETWTVKVLS